MKKITITLKFWHQYVNCWITEKNWPAYQSPIPELTICRRPIWHWPDEGRDGWFGPDPREWQIIHKGTQMPLYITGAPTRKAALWIVDQLPKIDWSQGQKEIVSIKGLYGIIVALHKET